MSDWVTILSETPSHDESTHIFPTTRTGNVGKKNEKKKTMLSSVEVAVNKCPNKTENEANS